MVRWIYFLSGLMLTAMIGTGLLLWTAKRARRVRERGFALVERLNLGFVGGTPIAFSAFFIANRLLSTDLPDRPAAEVHAVFWTWAFLIVFAIFREPAKAWRDLTTTAAVACAAIPLLDVLSGSWRADAVHVGVDLVSFAFAGAYAAAAMLATRGATKAGLRSTGRRWSTAA